MVLSITVPFGCPDVAVVVAGDVVAVADDCSRISEM